ncbi:unnamed protein product, partial [Gulo gulo]
FLLLSVSWQFLEGFDKQDRGGRSHFSLGLSVANGQFHGHPQTFRVSGFLGHVITSLFWRQPQGSDLWGQGRSGTDFTPGALRVHDFDLLGVKLRHPGEGSWCRMNPDSGQPSTVCVLYS